MASMLDLIVFGFGAALVAAAFFAVYDESAL